MGNNTTKEKGHLLTIGTVAKSFGVNENTIRRIEAAGLLKPAIISKDSGYRYYDIENLSRLSEILSLREFGFVYEDLREFFSEGGNYSALYQKLIEKQLAINALVDKFSYRMNVREYLECRIIDYTEAHCLCKEAMAETHDRMPVIVGAEEVRPYLTDLSAAMEIIATSAPVLCRETAS